MFSSTWLNRLLELYLVSTLLTNHKFVGKGDMSTLIAPPLSSNQINLISVVSIK